MLCFVLFFLSLLNIVWFGLEGTLKDHLVQPSSYEQGHLSLDQVVQSPIQWDLEHFQEWGIYNFTGQAVPVSHHPHDKIFLPIFLPYVQSISSISLNPLHLLLSLHSLVKSLSVFLIIPLYILKGHSEVSSDPSILQVEQPQLSQPFLIAEVFQPSDLFCGLIWTCSNRSMSFLC